MLGRMMVSALALTGVAYAEADTPPETTAATPSEVVAGSRRKR